MAGGPVLQSLHVLPQPGPQVSDADLLLLQRGQVLLRRRDFDPMVVDAGRVLRLAPESTQTGEHPH